MGAPPLRRKVELPRPSVIPRQGGLHGCRARCSHVTVLGEPTV
jgi:hypothetical protein